MAHKLYKHFFSKQIDAKQRHNSTQLYTNLQKLYKHLYYTQLYTIIQHITQLYTTFQHKFYNHAKLYKPSHNFMNKYKTLQNYYNTFTHPYTTLHNKKNATHLSNAKYTTFSML